MVTQQEQRRDLHELLVQTCEPSDSRLHVTSLAPFKACDLLLVDDEVLFVVQVDPEYLHVQRGMGGTFATGHNAGSSLRLVGVAVPETQGQV